MIQDLGWEDPKATDSFIRSWLKDNSYVIDNSPSIHSDNSIRFMTHVIKADLFVLNIMKQGVTLDFEHQPPNEYYEPNNRSALNHTEQLLDKVEKWIEEGSVIELDTKPSFCNPMSVNIERDHNNVIKKHRPCFDASRCLNKYMRKNSLQLDSLDKIEELLYPDCFQTNFDLCNMYFSFRVRKDQRKYLGFSIITKEKTRYFQFEVMVYGLRDAAYIVTRFFRPIKAFFHKIGIVFVIYIDDGKIIAKTFMLCEIQTQLVILFCQLIGFEINFKKSCLIPDKINHYQGFLTNSKLMRYYATEEKQSRYIFNIKSLIDRHNIQLNVPALEIAAVLGQLNSLFKSHGSIVRTMVRNLNYEMCYPVLLRGWETSCVLSRGIIELNYFISYLHTFNGTFIPITRTADMTVEQLQVRSMISNIILTKDNVPNLLVSDASASKLFMYYNDEITTVVDYDFNSDEMKYSSGKRELSAVLVFLKFCKESKKVFKTGCIYWQTDSSNGFFMLSHGSRNLKNMELVLQIKLLERDLNVRIIPIWTKRDHPRIVLADLGSKAQSDTDEWGISRPMLNHIFEYFKFVPNLDGFATQVSRKCNLFYSKYPQNNMQGLNFFSQPFNPDYQYYLCPPTRYISNVISWIQITKGFKGILILPHWPSSNFWCNIHTGNSFIQIIKGFYYFHTVPEIYHHFTVKNVFNCKRSMAMLALYIET